MKTSTSLSVHRVWFRRWNRHNYATFCSIGKCVNIGSVRKEIADKSLKKGLSITSTDTIVENMERSDKPSEEEHTAGSFFPPPRNFGEYRRYSDDKLLHRSFVRQQTDIY